MVAALLTYERIRTTLVKAKEIRRLAERAITCARRLGPLLTKAPEKRSAEESARVVHAMRMTLRAVRDRDAVLKLFEEIAPRFLARHGGYTRVMKIDQRPGDAAPMALLELIPADGAEAKPAHGKESGGAGKEKPSKTSGSASGPRPKGAPKTKVAPAAKGTSTVANRPAATMKRAGRSRGGE